MSAAALKNHIRTFRVLADLTQEEIAQKAGVTRQTIIAIEKGNYTPSVQLAIRLARTLGRPVEELFYEESE